MHVDELLECFRDTEVAVRRAVSELDAATRRARTERPGQYALDVVADAAALEVLHTAPVAVVSEESGRSGDPSARVTVVLDPVDGSTNCSRGIPYWAISLCAIDEEGALAALVTNQATGARVVAVRGEGVTRDGVPLQPSAVHRIEDAVVALSGMPARILPWRQFRALGCAALTLCDLAGGGIDGYLDGGSWHAPWDYLGGYLACVEAGAVIVDASGEALVTTLGSARRQVVAAATPELLSVLRPAAPLGRRP